MVVRSAQQAIKVSRRKWSVKTQGDEKHPPSKARTSRRRSVAVDRRHFWPLSIFFLTSTEVRLAANLTITERALWILYLHMLRLALRPGDADTFMNRIVGCGLMMLTIVQGYNLGGKSTINRLGSRQMQRQNIFTSYSASSNNFYSSSFQRKSS